MNMQQSDASALYNLQEPKKLRHGEAKSGPKKIKARIVILLTPQIASNLLKNQVGSLAHIRDEIIGSLDFAITGI
jgi:hypothetical protein